MAELRELALGVMQSGVGRLRRRARRLATLVGVDVDAVRSAARKAFETAQSLRELARPLERKTTHEAEPADRATFRTTHRASCEAPAVEGITSPGAPEVPAVAAPAVLEAPVTGGFFSGPGRGRLELQKGAQLRLFARDAWTLLALWEVGPSLKPADAQHARLELRLRPVGGSVTERHEIPLSGRWYFEGLVPGRTYLAELWWLAEGLSPEPVAVAPRSATLPVGPEREVTPESGDVPFVRVAWDTPRAPTRAAVPRAPVVARADRVRAHLTPVAMPSHLQGLPRGGLRASARVGWAGSPDQSRDAIEASGARAATSPSSSWAGSPERAVWGGSPGGDDRRVAGAGGAGGLDSSPGGRAIWAPPPVALPYKVPQQAAAPRKEAQHVPAPHAAPRSARATPAAPSAAERPLLSTPASRPSHAPHGGRRLEVPTAMPQPAKPAHTRQSRKAKARAKAQARIESARTAAVPAVSEGPVIHAGFFTPTQAALAPRRRPLAPAREGDPLSTAEALRDSSRSS